MARWSHELRHPIQICTAGPTLCILGTSGYAASLTDCVAGPVGPGPQSCGIACTVPRLSCTCQ